MERGRAIRSSFTGSGGAAGTVGRTIAGAVGTVGGAPAGAAGTRGGVFAGAGGAGAVGGGVDACDPPYFSHMDFTARRTPVGVRP